MKVADDDAEDGKLEADDQHRRQNHAKAQPPLTEASNVAAANQCEDAHSEKMEGPKEKCGFHHAGPPAMILGTI